MAQISLKEYIGKLERLLAEDAADEVIQNSRHILKYFPKNVAVFRCLGRALVMNGRWEEADGALRRVLTVLPDDYSAHLGLSEVYTALNRGDAAIAHLERAYELSPNSRELIDGLRGLYRRFRRMEQVKIQLTAAAIARQHRRSGALGQAMDVLRSALAKTPDRVDLRLLLAETLWESGARMDAAEVAITVLKQLPDCLTANRIMVQVWLDAQRPTDARRHLNRIEAVDPYLAYQLVQGEAAPADAFLLDEIDYQRFAQTELVSRRPDWLQSIGVTATTEVTSAPKDDAQPEWLSAAISSLPDEPRTAKAAARATDDDDWMAEVAAQTGQPSLTDQLNLPREFSTKPPGVTTSELEELFGDKQTPDWVIDDPFKQRAAAEDEAPSMDDLFAPIDPNASAMAWLPDPSRLDELEEIDEPPLRTLSGASVADAADMPEWMRQEMAAQVQPSDQVSGGAKAESESLEWLKDDLFQETAKESSSAAAPEVVAVDWLKDDLFAEQDDDLLTPNEDDDVPEWMRDSFVADDEPAPPTSKQGDADAPSWLQGDDDSPFGSAAEPVAAQPPTTGLTDMLQGADLDWLRDASASANTADASTPDTIDDWLDILDADQPATVERAAASVPSDFILELDMNDNQQSPSSKSDDNAFDWLSGDSAANSTADDLMPDLDALAPSAASSDDLSWLTEAEADANDDDQPDTLADAEIPDWLSALEPEADETPAAETPATGDDFAWLTEAQAEVEAVADELPAEPAADVPDWLSALEPQAEAKPLPEAEATAAGDDFAWLTEAQAEVEAAAAIEETPEWMRELESESEALVEAVSEDVVSDAGMDQWLVEVQDAGEIAPEATLASSDQDITAVMEEGGAETEIAAAPAADAISDALSEDVVPAWLAEAGAKISAGEDAETAVVEAEAADGFGWFSDPDKPAEAVAVGVDETPEWLRTVSEIETGTEESGESAEVDAITEAVTEIVEEAAAEAVAAEEPLLEEAAPIPAGAGAAGAAAGTAAKAGDFTDEVEAPAPAENAPDWLNAMVPGLDLNFEAREEIEEAEPVAASARRDYAWVIDIVESEASQTAPPPPRSRFIFSKPPAWLRKREDEDENGSKQDDGLPDWPNDDAERAASEPNPRKQDDDDMPEWLR